MEFRLACWEWLHKKAEELWHWIYYKRVQPLRRAAGLDGSSAPVIYSGSYQYRSEWANSKGEIIPLSDNLAKANLETVAQTLGREGPIQ